MWLYGDTETYNGKSLEITITICGKTLEGPLSKEVTCCTSDTGTVEKRMQKQSAEEKVE